MILKENDLMGCEQCGKESKVKDLKRVLPQQDEAGVLAVLVCPFCGCPQLQKATERKHD